MPPVRSIVTLFETGILTHPEAIALSWSGGQWSYRDLNREANIVAHRLRDAGIGVGDIVAIRQPRSAQTIAAMVGILKAGAAYLPLDLRSPEERLRLLCREAGVRAAVVSATGGAEWPEPMVVVAIGGEDSPDPGNLPLTAGLDDAAYVMYTSGSTGTPKGVEVPHRGVVRLVVGTDFAALGPETVCLHHSPAAFDASTLEIWGPLLHGGRCHLAPPDLDLETLMTTIQGAGLNLLWLTASLFNAVVETSPEVLARVAHVITGGEALSPSHIRLAQQAAPQTLFTNGYGPTESTTFTCCYPIPRPFTGDRVPIGKPIANTEVHLLDERGKPVGPEETGEIYIGGDGLAIGYRNRPDLTAEAFVSDPFSAGRKLYRSGDMARRLSDGNLDFLGRRDRQVKIRGFRIELEEIEETILSHSAVASACVMARDAGLAEKRLTAFIVLRTGVSRPALREYLAAKLPDYMIPAAIEVLPSLPLLSNGKLDRSALERIPVAESGGLDFVAPAPGLEAEVAALVAELLGIQRVSSRDNLFHLGAHSLTVMRLLVRIRSRWGAIIGLREVYSEPSVEGLVRLIGPRRGIGSRTSTPLGPRELAGPAILSHSQEGHWTLDRLGLGGLHHVIPLGFELRGKLDTVALGQAAADIVSRHEGFRTTFSEDGGGQLRQVILAPELSPVEYIGEITEEEWQKRSEIFLRLPMNLSGGPLFRGLLGRLSADRHILLLTIHHIVFDGWSLGIFRRELSELYAARVEGRVSALPPLPLQFADYAVWERTNTHPAESRPGLDGLPELLELTPKRRPARLTFEGRREPVRLSREICAAARAAGAAEGASLFMTLLAAFKGVLHRYSGQEDIVIGTPWANREMEEAERIVGFFINTLVIRTQLNPEWNFRRTLAAVRDSSLEAFSYSHIPFATLLEHSRVRRDPAHHPLFQVMFVLQNAPREAMLLPELETEELLLDNGSSQFDLTLSLEEAGEEITGYLEYSTALFDTEFAQGLCRHYCEFLRAAAAAPSHRIADVPLMSAGESAGILAQGQGETVPFPETNLAFLFEQQAAARGAAEAVVTETGSWSFADLRQRSNAIAWRLREANVQPGRLVGVCMRRSPQVVASLIGIWKAGAVYVPLDPSYPKDRLLWIIQDANIEMLVTDRENRPGWYTGQVLLWDEIDGREIRQAPPLEADPNQLAYVFYTSGSTGRPNGVAGEHRALANRLQWMWSRFPYAPNERACLKTPLNFIDSLSEILGPLLAGIPAVVIPEPALTDARRLLDLLGQHRVTRIVLVPSLLQAILDAVPDLGKRLPDLHFWVCSGEALRPDLASRFLDAMPGRVLLNLYGSSEVCADVTWHVVDREDADTVPIGRPIANTQAMVLDAHGQLAPIGVAGELNIGGTPLARGYWNNPSLTAGRFVHTVGGRLFRTGDRAVLTRHGTFTYLGRIDLQVKIRGQRVEPGEVAALLREMPGVRDAAVISSASPAGETFLTGFVVAEGGEPAVWLEELRRQLPAYMVPRSLTVLDALPLLPNGKVDRKALVAAVPAAPMTAQEPRPPQDQLERDLCAIWDGLLPVSSLDTTADFFALGGSSLVALRMFARMESEMGVILPAASIFEAPTVRQLASLIRKKEDGRSSLVVRIRKDGPGAPLFCLHGAKGGLLEYGQLANALAGVCPVYGVQAAGLDGTRPPHWNAAQMLNEYLREIRQAQPVGPYRLCGHSYGGLLAYAIACQLAGEGESIDFLGIFDMPAGDLVRRESARGFLQWVAARSATKFDLYRRDDNAGRWRRLRSDVHSRFVALRFLLWTGGLRLKTLTGKQISLPYSDLDQGLQMVFRRGYRAPHYDGSIVLFRAEEDDEYLATQPEDLGWSRLVRGEVRVIRVPGDHNTMIQAPYAGYLAAAMRPYLGGSGG